jgi:hypothetical protein
LKIPASPSIEIFSNKGGGVTLKFEDYESREEGLVGIPLHMVRQVAAALIEEAEKIEEDLRLAAMEEDPNE